MLLLPRSLLPLWDGADFSSDDRVINAKSRWIPEGPPTDYDRACDLGEIGILPVGSGEGLVLGDEPLSTAWWPLTDQRGGMLVRWVYAESDEDVVRALRSLSGELFPSTALSFSVDDGMLVLFDSAMPGREIATATLDIRLSPGRYKIATARYAPDSETSLVLHRVTPTK